MRLPEALAERLRFLSQVVRKECVHLTDTDQRLFMQALTEQQLVLISTDPILAERLDAFICRFGRLQDSVGDKLLPALLTALAESPGAAIDNLDKAEKFGLITSADQWIEMRRLRNQMVHEYIEDLTVLSSALRTGHQYVPDLVSAARRCVAEAHRVLDLYQR